MPTSARAGVVYFHDLVEWGNVIYYPVPLSYSMHYGGSVRFRADVGIGPYIRVGVRSVQRTLY